MARCSAPQQTKSRSGAHTRAHPEKRERSRMQSANEHTSAEEKTGMAAPARRNVISAHWPRGN
eukprot:5896645-Pyramimonas_sp.AAC.1